MKINKFYRLAARLFLITSSILSFSAFAQKSFTDLLPSNAQVLFIQVANAGELIPTQKDPETYKLVLKKIDPYTSYFTDRPNRVTGILPTHQFVDLWGRQADINTSPPNVAIETSDVKNGNRINRVFVLTNPVYDSNKQEMTYTAKQLDKKARPTARLDLGYTVLFIDDFNWHGNKF